MKRVWAYIKTHPFVWWWLAFPGYLIGFFAVERLVDGTAPYFVSAVPSDALIPFCEWFVIFYVLWYPYLAFPALYLMLKDPKIFKRFALYFTVVMATSLVIFVLFPNGQDLRPAVFPRDNLFTRLIGCLYRADTNTNVLPSMHVVGCFGVMVTAFESPALKKARWWLVALGVLICASTVLIKQHSMLDCYAGLLLGILAGIPIFLVPRLREKRKDEQS